jgi:hypothetical protein
MASKHQWISACRIVLHHAAQKTWRS